MFSKVGDADFVRGEHEVLRFWNDRRIFDTLRRQNAGGEPWSFLDGPITANNPMGVHHAWGRTYKDAYQRYHSMNGRRLRHQNGFDCQGLWVEVEVEKQLGFTTKRAIEEYGVDAFVRECKRRVLRFAARQTEQSIRLGYWMDWDRPNELRQLAEAIGNTETHSYVAANGEVVEDDPERIAGRLGNPDWGGSYFTFSTENNETIWAFIKKCYERGKVYRGYDVMPWSGRGGSAYSQMEVADGRKLTVHRAIFARFPLRERDNEHVLVWTTTPWTLTCNITAAVNADLDYVKIRAKRDGAIYYLAKENLEYKRLAREFKEGFGRPEWSWPKATPKLKTIAQIFKEQGGFEVLETVKGADLIGLTYDGPFDELPALNSPGGFPEDETLRDQTGASGHRVIDGGRDSKGNPHVVAGEGTGIVHMAPGCGDVDYQIGRREGLVRIAPLAEDGSFIDGFGPFSGRRAVDPETVDMVIASLKEKGYLVNVEEYPHIYPHCWRTGDELVFRLVDEWFINMDWRDEIKRNVQEQTEWIPEAIDGKNRELEWLTNMRDWMISKKRFWGLALPIWYDEQSGDFEVIGSLAELKERAVEGWDAFEGHTPHKPWIDAVKIRNPETGNLMSRIKDVGNPWLDAGIVPFSTLGYNRDLDTWKNWYPADMVTECFPGQFRNWFYSLLSMATMMDDSVPFRTLLGHRLVMDEDGRPMHKSDGTAIWFEEAAEQIGVDTMRWMYMSANPASDLRFGRRIPDEQVTLQTPDGPITETLEGIPTRKVVSRPADEIRRQVLIPLWNSYKFFVEYAQLDEFDPNVEPIPPADRPLIDRWILSNLQALIETAHQAWLAFDVAGFCQATAEFVDDLSNWYIRRNRRRFWRSRDVGDTDKLAAYQTLYTVLVELTKLIAPCVPFLAERMYRNLVTGWDAEAPESVHLCRYPQANSTVLDPTLNQRMATAQRAVRLGHKLREEAGQRVRQPLPVLRYVSGDLDQAEALSALGDVIVDELNVKALEPADSLGDLVSYQFKPNLKTLGPRYGKLVGALQKELPAFDSSLLLPLIQGESVTVTIAGEPVALEPNDVLVTKSQADGWVVSEERGLGLALAIDLSPELVREGLARDFVRQVQQMRKDLNLEVKDRIAITFARPLHDTSGTENIDEAESIGNGTASSVASELEGALADWGGYICEETQADTLEPSDDVPDDARPGVNIGGERVPVWIRRNS